MYMILHYDVQACKSVYVNACTAHFGYGYSHETTSWLSAWVAGHNFLVLRQYGVDIQVEATVASGEKEEEEAPLECHETPDHCQVVAWTLNDQSCKDITHQIHRYKWMNPWMNEWNFASHLTNKKKDWIYTGMKIWGLELQSYFKRSVPNLQGLKDGPVRLKIQRKCMHQQHL